MSNKPKEYLSLEQNPSSAYEKVNNRDEYDIEEFTDEEDPKTPHKMAIDIPSSIHTYTEASKRSTKKNVKSFNLTKTSIKQMLQPSESGIGSYIEKDENMSLSSIAKETPVVSEYGDYMPESQPLIK